MDLASLRANIDLADDQILDLLNARAKLVAEVRKLKERLEVPFYVPSRERQIVERLVSKNEGPFPSAALQPVFQEIFSACLKLEGQLRVAYLGPEATFTHLAVKRQFGLSAQAVPAGTISAVFGEVERGNAEFGVVPIENSSEGVVHHTLDTFLESELKISAEILLPISHSLLARADLELSGIARLYSHPQALAQCRRWISANLPHAVWVEASSTTEAARLAREDAQGAAIAAEAAAPLYDLAMLRRKIEDAAQNFTRFLVIGHKQAERTGKDRTSLLFTLGDQPGVLYRVLKPFAEGGVNMSTIESRPSHRQPWEYVFFVDVDGHASDAAITQALEEAKQIADNVKVLGSYPRAESS